MRLSEIKWMEQNKIVDRSQVLYEVGTNNIYLLMREPLPGESAKPPALRTRFRYKLYADGSVLTMQTEDPTAILEHLWPHKMTPLELKCWKMEQGK